MESGQGFAAYFKGKVNQFSKVKNSLREVVSDKFGGHMDWLIRDVKARPLSGAV